MQVLMHQECSQNAINTVKKLLQEQGGPRAPTANISFTSFPCFNIRCPLSIWTFLTSSVLLSRLLTWQSCSLFPHLQNFLLDGSWTFVGLVTGILGSYKSFVLTHRNFQQLNKFMLNLKHFAIQKSLSKFFYSNFTLQNGRIHFRN